MFASLAKSVIAHPWRTIVLWLIAAVVVVAFSPKLSSYTTSNQQSFLPNSFESIKAQNVGNRAFPAQSGATGSIVVSRVDAGQLTTTDQQKVGALVTTLTNDKIPAVAGVKLPQNAVAANGKVMSVQVAFSGQPGDHQVNSAVGEVRSTSDAFLAGSGLKNGLTGNAAISVDTTRAYNHADSIITIATVVLIILLLGLVFRSPIIAVLPIVVIGIVHSVAVGITADLADAFGFQVSNSVAPILVVVLFGVGADYIIFLLFRYRERLRAGLSHEEAVGFASHVVGVVIASSALTVIGAFAALLLAKLGSLQTLAPALIVAVAAMLLTALTLVPALFVLLGKALFWPFGPGKTPQGGVFSREADLVSRHPGLVAGGLLVVLAALTVAAGGYKPTYNTLSELPSNTASQVAFNTLSTGFPAGALSPTQVYVSSAQPLTQSALQPLTANLSKTEGVSQVAPPTISSDGKTALVSVILKDDPYSNAALNNLAGPVRAAAHSSLPGDQVLVGGQTSTYVDIRNQLHRDTTRVFPVAAVLIALILGLLLTAIIAPLNLLACVGLAFTGTLGAVVLVFLHGTGYSGIDFTIPITLYLFVVAIGTDYNILMSSRLREEFANGYSPREAVRIAIANDAPTVAAAGLILALTFASLMLAGLANLSELGFGVAVGIIIAAFGMAPMLVPALSALERHICWWPRHQRPHAKPEPEPEPEPELAPPGPAR